MNRITDVIGQFEAPHVEDIETSESFVELGRRFSDLAGTVILLSGGDLDSARYNLIATYPVFSLVSYGNQVTLTRSDRATTIEADPFAVLQTIIDKCQIHNLTERFGPIMSGLFGYLSYDLKDHIEVLPKTTSDDLHLPDMLFYAPSVILVQDKKSRQSKLIKLNWSDSEGHSNIGEIDSFESRMKTTPAMTIPPYQVYGELKSNLSKSEYVYSIDRVREYITAGDIYQVNMSHRFEVGYGGDPYSYFTSMFAHNPAPFFAFINGGDHHVVSTSPERFILREGTYAETRPIKGTCPRSEDPSEDEIFKNELLNSLKDEAELSMIVDLLRNDLGKVCQAGTVKVKTHKKLEAYQNVYHLVSTIEGKLSSQTTDTELIKALFPGGSITGCPKIRSIEIIDELEQYRRHIYTGSIGYISFHQTMDFSIAIRTATITNGRLIFSVGGGIVYDSEAESEHAETMSKGKTMITHLVKSDKPNQPPDFLWINGKFTPRANAVIPVDDLGLSYGYGLFETIRCDQGKIRFLDKHIERLSVSYRQLFGRPMERYSWENVIGRLLELNHLFETTATAKIMVTKNARTTASPLNELVVTVKPYLPRFPKKNGQAAILGSYSQPRQSFLADHKTMSYLHYYMAGKWARERGFDEAIITNSDYTISETNTANILIIRDHHVIRPASPHVLPGTTEDSVLHILKCQEFDIEKSPIKVEDIKSTDQVIITNSLIGAVSVGRIDNITLTDSMDLALNLTNELFH